MSKLCTLPDCGKPHMARGYCKKHYQTFLAHGDPLGRAERAERVVKLCSVPDCGKPHKAHGYCGRHAQAFVAHGDPLGRAPSAR